MFAKMTLHNFSITRSCIWTISGQWLRQISLFQTNVQYAAERKTSLHIMQIDKYTRHRPQICMRKDEDIYNGVCCYLRRIDNALCGESYRSIHCGCSGRSYLSRGVPSIDCIRCGAPRTLTAWLMWFYGRHGPTEGRQVKRRS